MSKTIYISRKCEYCHELLILLHKNRDILKFPVVDVHTKPYPKIVTSVPCMVVEDKVLPGEELFKFLNYLIEQNSNNSDDVSNDLMPPRDKHNNMNNHRIKSRTIKDNVYKLMSIRSEIKKFLVKNLNNT